MPKRSLSWVTAMEIKETTLGALFVGATLPAFQKAITQADIDQYAKVSGDLNPIHINPEYARSTPLGTTVAHGMLLLAYISQVMTKAFGTAWLQKGRMYARFKTPARPGDTISITGTVTKIDMHEGKSTIHCEILCRNQNGEELILSQTEVQMTP